MFVFFLTFGVSLARFVPYAEFNMYPDLESAINLRAEMENEIITGRATLKGKDGLVSGEATIDFKLGQDLPGFVSLYDEKESTGVNCTWKKLDMPVISHLFQKGQGLVNSHFLGQEDLAAYIETNKYGSSVDGLTCIVATEVKHCIKPSTHFN